DAQRCRSAQPDAGVGTRGGDPQSHLRRQSDRVVRFPAGRALTVMPPTRKTPPQRGPKSHDQLLRGHVKNLITAPVTRNSAIGSNDKSARFGLWEPRRE